MVFDELKKIFMNDYIRGVIRKFAVHCDRLSSDKFQLSQKFLKHFSSIA